QTVPSENTAVRGRSLIRCACRTSHVAPEITTMKRLATAIHASRERTTAATLPSLVTFRNAGSAKKAKKKVIPTTITVAAKWRARTQISGSFKAPSFDRAQLPNPLLLADPKSEITLNLVGVRCYRSPFHL